MPGCMMSVARRDALVSDLEQSRLFEASPIVPQGANDTSEVGHGKEMTMGETDEERIGGISKPIVASPPEDTGPFCLFRPLDQGNTEGASATATSASHTDLQQLLQSFASSTLHQGKKMKSSLSSFLPTIPGDVDNPGVGDASLRSLVLNPPIGGKELVNLPLHLLSGFKLRPGPIPEQFRTAFHEKPKKKKRKKPKFHTLEQQQEIQPSVRADVTRDGLTGATTAGLLGSAGAAMTVPVVGIATASSLLPVTQNGGEVVQQVLKKQKKRKHEDGDREKDRKKKKKERKKKKEKHRSPQPGGSGQTVRDGVKPL